MAYDQMPPGAPPAYGYDAPPAVGGGGGASNEELIEAIIDEKWNELVKDVNKIVAWKEAMGARIERLEQRLLDVKGQMDKLQETVIGKVGEYDRNIVNVGAQVQAMDKFFSKVLPSFTESVAELSRITSSLKTPPQASTPRESKR